MRVSARDPTAPLRSQYERPLGRRAVVLKLNDFSRLQAVVIAERKMLLSRKRCKMRCCHRS